MAGQNYLCHAVRNHVEEVRSFNVLVAELKLSTIHDGGSVVVEGDEITIKCETYLMPANMTWISAADTTNQAVEITFRNLPGGMEILYSCKHLGFFYFLIFYLR